MENLNYQTSKQTNEHRQYIYIIFPSFLTRRRTQRLFIICVISKQRFHIVYILFCDILVFAILYIYIYLIIYRHAHPGLKYIISMYAHIP